MIKLIVVGALVVFLVARYRTRAAAVADQSAPADLPTAAPEAAAKGGTTRRTKKTSEKSPSTRLQRVRPRMRVPIPDSADTMEPLAEAATADDPPTAAHDVPDETLATSELTVPRTDGATTNTLDAIVPASGWPDPVSFKDANVEVSTDDADDLDMSEPAILGTDAGWAEIDMNEVGMDDALVTMPSTPPAQEWAEDDGFDPASGWSDDPSATDTSWSSGGSSDTPAHDDAEWGADGPHGTQPDSENPAWDMLNAAVWQNDEPEPVAAATSEPDQEPSWDVSDWATPEPESAEPTTVQSFDTSEPTQDFPLIASAIDDGLPTIAAEPHTTGEVADAQATESHVEEPAATAADLTPVEDETAHPVAPIIDEIHETLPALELPVEPVKEPILDASVSDAAPIEAPLEINVEEPAADVHLDESIVAPVDTPIFDAPVALEPTPLAPFVEVPVTDEQFAVAHFEDPASAAPIDVPSVPVETNHVTWEVEEPDPLAPAPISQEWVESAAEMAANAPMRHVRPESADPTAPVIMYLQSGDQEMKVVIERDHTGNPLAWVLSGVAKVDAEGSAIRVRIPSPDADDDVTRIDVGGHASVAADVADAEPAPAETFDVVVEVHPAETADEPLAEQVTQVMPVVADTVDASHDAPVDEPDTAGLGALAFDEQGISPVEGEQEAPAPAQPVVEAHPEPEMVAAPVVEAVVEEPVAPPAPAAMDPIVVALLDRLADTERALVELSTRSADESHIESKSSSKKPKRKQARKRARAGASAQMHGEFNDDVPDMTPNADSRSKAESGTKETRAPRPAPGTASRPIITKPRVAERDTDAPAPRDTRPRPKKRDERQDRATVDTRTAPQAMPVTADADNPLDIAALVQAEANRRVAEVLAQHGSVKTNGDFSGLVDRLEHVLDDDSRSKA